MNKCLALFLVLLSSANLTAREREAAPTANWSHWRGPEQNGISRQKDLPDKFDVVWRVPHGGRSTPIVQNGRIYLINKTGEGATEQERVMCFDEKDGKVLWQHKFNVFLTDIVADRLGWTQPAGDPETGYVYTHGTQGLLYCFDKDGKIIWDRSLTEEYGRISGYGGRVTSPIIDGDLLLLGMINASWGHQGMGRCRFVAFQKKTGRVVWWASTEHPVRDTYYSTPIVVNINGERLLISGGGDGGVHAFKVRTGEKVWSHIFSTGAVNCSPVIDGNLVYIGHGEQNENSTRQGRVLCLDASQVEKGEPKLVWKVDGIKAKFASPVIQDGRLYICNDLGTLYCLEGKTGKELWKYRYGKNTKGSPVLGDGKIYLPEADSQFHILQPGSEDCKVLHSERFRQPGVTVELNGSPVVANGRVYFMTSTELICIGKKDAKVASDKIPEPSAEAKGDSKPARLQVFPADVVLHPGDTVKLTARAFNDKGQPLGDVKAEWSLAGMRPPEGAPPPPTGTAPPPAPPALQGELSDKSDSVTTTLTATAMPPVQFGRVTAKMGELTADCRIRVVAKLPYTANFAPVRVGGTPASWINASGKFEIVELNGGDGGKRKVLKKRANNSNPLVARANTFINMPELSDYTIEADVMGKKVGDDMPDVGIICQRYTLMLTGNTQALRLYTWEAVPRLDKTLAFTWKPDEWYRLKLTVEIEGDKGVVKGKIWPRDKEEPKDWTVELTDPVPNREGAPGLYGFALNILEDQVGTEIFYDNVKVTPNKKK